MYFNPISKWVMHEKSFPWRRTAIISCYGRGLQLRAQAVHVLAFQAKMSIHIRPDAILFHRNVHVQAAGIEPGAAASANGFGLGNFPQSQ